MRTIYKYPLQIADSQTISLPASAKPLSVQLQGGRLCLWAEVNTAIGGKDKEVVISVVGTGMPIPPGAVLYLGTVQTGLYVWHIYASAAIGEGA